jgi:hypothetical protein
MIGFDAPPAAGGLAPIPFVVPFTVANIDPSSDYFVYAAVYDTGRSWENKAGVPVITKGNPFEGIQVPTVQTASASPSPSATASAAPTAAPTTAASATPAPTASGGTSGSGGGGIDPIVLGVLALVVIGGAAVVFYMRR